VAGATVTVETPARLHFGLLDVRASAPPDRVALGGGERPLACFGEVGLTGELRSVGHADRRLAEARKFGLAEIVGPRESGARFEAPTLRAALRAALGPARDSPGARDTRAA